VWVTFLPKGVQFRAAAGYWLELVRPPSLSSAAQAPTVTVGFGLGRRRLEPQESLKMVGASEILWLPARRPAWQVGGPTPRKSQRIISG